MATPSTIYKGSDEEFIVAIPRITTRFAYAPGWLELEKIFTKKSLYIILLILFVIIFGTYINERNENVRSELELEIQNVEIQKSNIDTTSNSGLREYLELDTNVIYYKIYKKDMEIIHGKHM